MKKKAKKNELKLYELTLGYSCNTNCQFCSIDYSKRKINKSTIEAMQDIYNAKKQNFKIIGFGGGEPTIRKDIIKLVLLAKELKFETIRIQTNGILLSYKTFCKEIIAAGANYFKISIHGHSAKIHDQLTQVPGSFNQVLKGIDHLHELNTRIHADIVLNRINYKFLPQFISFFSSKGILSYCIIFPTYTGSMKKNQKLIGITLTESIEYIHEACELIDALKIDAGVVMNVPYCFMKGHEKRVVDSLNMKLSTPDIIIQDNDEYIKKGKKKLSTCKTCEYRNRCSGIWKNYLEFFGERDFINQKQ